MEKVTPIMAQDFRDRIYQMLINEAAWNVAMSKPTNDTKEIINLYDEFIIDFLTIFKLSPQHTEKGIYLNQLVLFKKLVVEYCNYLLDYRMKEDIENFKIDPKEIESIRQRLLLSLIDIAFTFAEPNITTIEEMSLFEKSHIRRLVDYSLKPYLTQGLNGEHEAIIKYCENLKNIFIKYYKDNILYLQPYDGFNMIDALDSYRDNDD